MAKSMSGQSSLFDLTTCEGSRSVTFSQESEDGAPRFVSLDGPMTGTFGPARVRASDSRAPHVGGWWLRIFGRSGHGSSLNADLARCLVNRLSTNAGQILSYSTWSIWATKSGRRWCRLALSVSTMRANGFTLWATPTSTANQACPSMQKWPGCRGIVVTPDAWGRRMGYPGTWLRSLDSAMPSSRRSRRSSLKPTVTHEV